MTSPSAPQNAESRAPAGDCFAGEGEMSQLMRAFPWEKTPLGAARDWPQSLKTSVSLMLGARHPMWIGWGPEMTFLYNDAYQAVLGAAKHPWALGRPASEVWAEIWDVCGPLADAVFDRAEASFVDDVRLFMRRENFTEEVFYSFSYSPIRDESGEVNGLFCPSTDSTASHLNTRRLATLSELSGKALLEKSVAAAGASAIRALANNLDDVPFALLYMLDGDGRSATLHEASRLPRESPLALPSVPIEDGDQEPWPVSKVLREGKAKVVSVAHLDFPFLGLAEQRLTHAMVLPIVAHADERPIGALVVGVSPARPLDSEYSTFFSLVAGQVAAAISNARAAEEERRRADELAELDRAKTVFFSNISHELRTPLTLMLGPIEEILRQPEGGVLPDNRALADMAHRSGLRLLKLVNTLLDFSRIEAGRVQASYMPTDLAAFTAELASVFRSAVEKAGLRLVIDCPPLPEPVYVDREMWEKIVLNLLSNALKFTFEGEIEISLRWQGESVELKVRDTGVGIPKQELSKVFERFHRVREMRSRTHEGTGIGLALVRELAALHSGTATVESEEGKGTTFSVAVRTGAGHLSADRLRVATSPFSSPVVASAFVGEAERWLPAAEEGSTLVDQTMASRNSPLVLLADDNADMRDYVARLLAPHFRVEAVPDGETALMRIRETPPDLVLSDVMMPRLDGFGLLSRLREDPRTRAIPVVLLSARAGEEAKVEGLEAGADDYLIKPFSARELLARVRSQLEMAKLRRESAAVQRLFGERLKESERRFRALVTASSDVVYQMNADWSEMRRLHGRDFIASTEEPDRSWLEKYICPDDRLKVMAAIGEAVERKEIFELEHRIIQRDGTVGWTFSRAVPILDAHGEILEWFGAATDITARKEAEEALRTSMDEAHRSRKQAEAASRAKDDFLAALSHELRNPLTPVLMSATELATDPALPGETREQLAMIRRNVSLEARLIDDLLDLTRISRGKLPVHFAPADAHALLRHAEEIVRADMFDRSVSLSFHLEAAEHHVLGDAARLQQVFWNLLKNAVKFTPDGGQITVRTSNPKGSRLVIAVQDSGYGIPPEALDRIFRPFEQGHLESRHRFGGLGLGLSISKALVDLHGGTLEASSDGLNKGATFTIELATTRVAVRSTGSSKDGKAPLDLRPLRLLVVEDHAPTLEVMARLLRRDGHDVVTASSVQAALEAAAGGRRFDLMISDLGLPDGTGMELMREIRNRHGWPGIALSGFGMESDLRETAEAGFSEHLTKPVDISELRRAIRRQVLESEAR